MPDLRTHKLIQPVPKDGDLEDLILCWRHDNLEEGSVFTKFALSINDVDCNDCKELWGYGYYS